MKRAFSSCGPLLLAPRLVTGVAARVCCFGLSSSAGFPRRFSLAAPQAAATTAGAASARPEDRMVSILKTGLSASIVEVRDVSGGCGAFYNVLVVASSFASMSTMKQHRLVTDLLQKDIVQMHGLTIKTMTPEAHAASKKLAEAAAAEKAAVR